MRAIGRTSCIEREFIHSAKSASEQEVRRKLFLANIAGVNLFHHAGFGPRLRLSGRFALSGICQPRIDLVARGMRPWSSNCSTRWREQPQRSAVSLVVSIFSSTKSHTSK
jgi:hypothetical protein